MLFTVSLTTPSANSIETVPLQFLYPSVFLTFSKSDNTNWYCCPTTCVVPFTCAVKSCTFVRFFVISPAISLSIKTFISSAVSWSVVSKYLSITLNIIVSVFALSSFVDEIFSITGFMKSACPNSKCVFRFWFPDWSVAIPSGISISTFPLHSLNILPACNSNSSKFDIVNVAFHPYIAITLPPPSIGVLLSDNEIG